MKAMHELDQEGGVTEVSKANARKLIDADDEPVIIELWVSPEHGQVVTARWLSGEKHDFTGFSWGYGGEGPHGLEWFASRVGMQNVLPWSRILSGENLPETTGAPGALFLCYEDEWAEAASGKAKAPEKPTTVWLAYRVLRFGDDELRIFLGVYKNGVLALQAAEDDAEVMTGEDKEKARRLLGCTGVRPFVREEEVKR